MKKQWLACILSVVLCFSSCSAEGNFGDILQNLIPGITDQGGTGNQGGNQEDNQGGNQGNTSKENCVDKNDDGVCDDCKESVIIPLSIIAVNDLHGKLLDGDNHLGVDEMSTWIKDVRAENPNTILLSSGDMWQGASASNLTRGRIVTDWMNEMDFVSMTLGNHEYDWGEDAIKENAELAQFPLLAINIYSKTTNERVDYCQSSVLVEQGNIKVGIIGAMGDCYSSIASDKVSGVTFKTGSALTSLVKAEAQSLRDRGADCIIYSVHDGHSNCDSSLSEYVDVVFEGHTHSSYVYDSNGIYHLQGGGDNKGLTYAELTVNVARNESDTKKAEFVSSSVYANLTPDPIVSTLEKKYADEIAKADEVLGWNDTVRQSSEISSLVAKLYYEAGIEKWGDKYDIVLGGGSLNLRSPYKILAGEVMYADVQNVLPFDNQIELCKVKGSVLKSRFINNSDYYVYYQSSLTSSIVDSKDYYIVLDTWSSRYSVNKTTVVDRYDETTFARDLLAKYIQKGGWGKKPGTENITLTSIPEIHALSNTLSANEATTKSYYVKGKIISVAQKYYGNVVIEDENGQKLFVYGTYDAIGNRYGDMSSPPAVGATVVLYAKVKKYKNDYGTVELYEAILISVE